jgi:hypothetical protein
VRVSASALAYERGKRVIMREREENALSEGKDFWERKSVVRREWNDSKEKEQILVSGGVLSGREKRKGERWRVSPGRRCDRATWGKKRELETDRK